MSLSRCVLDFPVPTEYIINCQIKEKLAPIDLSRYSEDTLFYLFYMNGGDLMQLQAASILYDRDWRYHVEKRFWLTKVPGIEPQQKTNTFEKGVYTVFDISQWRRLQLEMTIEYNKLADKPQIPQHLLIQQQQATNPVTANIPTALQQQLQQQQAFTSALNTVTSSLASLAVNQTTAPSFWSFAFSLFSLEFSEYNKMFITKISTKNSILFIFVRIFLSTFF